MDIVDSLGRTDLKDLGIPLGDVVRMEKAFQKMKIEVDRTNVPRSFVF